MRAPSTGALAAGAIGAAALLLVAVGAPLGRHSAPPPQRAAPPPAGVSAGGFTLTSVAIEPVTEEESLPDGLDAVGAHCTACHSPSMILTQPPLSAAQWQATVAKMREAYHAPIAEADVPGIVAELAAFSARRSGPVAQAQDPAPRAPPRP